MTIQGITPGFNQIASITKTQESQATQGAGAAQQGKSFSDMLGSAIKEVDQMQQGADKQIESLVLGKGDTTPHEAIIALEKADMAFQLMNQIRSKIIRAYEDVMRTQV